MGVAWCGGILSRHLTDVEWPKIDSLKAPDQISKKKIILMSSQN